MKREAEESEEDEDEGEEERGRKREGEGGKKRGEDEKEKNKGNLPKQPSVLSLFPRNKAMDNVVEEKREREEEEVDRKGKGKIPARGMGMRKSVSENFTNKYKVGNQKKGGFGLFFLKKKT
jgi:hypothetical protein